MAEKDLDPTLKNHLALALGQLGHAKKHRENVLPGTYTVDETIRLHAVVRVEQDVETRQVNKIDPWTILALALDKLNATTLDTVLAEAQAIIDAKDAKRNSELKEIKRMVEGKVSGLKDATKIVRKGKVQILTQTVEVVQVGSRKREEGVEVGEEEVIEQTAPTKKKDKAKAKPRVSSSPASPVTKKKIDKTKKKARAKKKVKAGK